MKRRFLHIPELNNAERWKFHSVIDHPVFKQGPLLKFVSGDKAFMINRQLFYMMMTGRMEMEK